MHDREQALSLAGPRVIATLAVLIVPTLAALGASWTVHHRFPEGEEPLGGPSGLPWEERLQVLMATRAAIVALKAADRAARPGAASGLIATATPAQHQWRPEGMSHPLPSPASA